MLTLVSKKARLIVASMLLVVGLASSASAYFYLYPPKVPPAGLSVKQLGPRFWKWIYTTPEATNPLLDTNGSKIANGQSQNGQFFFLPGYIDGTKIVRNVSIPVGKHIAFPVVTGAYGAYAKTTNPPLDGDPPEQSTEAFVRAQVDYVKNATNLEVYIDGTKINNVKDYLVESDLFEVTLPANNIYGEPAGRKLKPIAEKGIWLALTPFNPGAHSIRWKSTVGEFSQDITYNITQKYTP